MCYAASDIRVHQPAKLPRKSKLHEVTRHAFHKFNPFWKEKHAAPSPCFVTKMKYDNLERGRV